MKFSISRIIPRSEFLRNNIQMISGTMLAQVINFLFNIYLTRVYSPVSFGKFSLFMSVLSVCLVFSAFKLDIEIVKSDGAHKVYKNMVWAYQANILVSICSLFLFALLRYLNYFHLQDYSWIWVIAVFIIVFLQTSVQILWMYGIKNKLYSHQSQYKIYEALVMNISYVLVYRLKDLGLLIANIFSLIVNNGLLIMFFRKHLPILKLSKDVLNRLEFSELIEKLIQQRYYILQSVLEILQVSLISFYFSEKTEFLGYYYLSMRVLQVPFRLLSLPISQVFFSEIAARKNKGENSMPLVRKSLWMMVAFTIPIIGIILWWGETLFGWVFGEPWQYSGRIAKILLIWMMADFIKANMMQIMYLYERQQEVFRNLLWSVFLMIIIFYAGRYFRWSEYQILWLISITQSIFIIRIIVRSYQVIKMHHETI